MDSHKDSSCHRPFLFIFVHPHYHFFYTLCITILKLHFKLTMGLLALVMVINLTGKGNLAPTTAMEQIQNYVLGGIIGGVIYSKDLHLIQFAVVLGIWFLLVFGLRKLKSRNHFLQRVLDGKPTVLIVNGEIDVEACRSAKITAQELTFKLRMHSIFDIRKVKRAVLEQKRTTSSQCFLAKKI